MVKASATYMKASATYSGDTTIKVAWTKELAWDTR